MELLIWPPAHFRQKELIKKKKSCFVPYFINLIDCVKVMSSN